jgi:hypothetical protein
MNYTKPGLHIVRQLVFLSAVLLVTACSNKASTFVPAPQDADKGSTIYIYRPSSSTNFMMSPKVVIDGNEKFKIGSGDYRYVYLQTGRHTLGLIPTDQYITDAALELAVETDKSYYLRVKTSLQFEPDTMNTRKFWIEQVTEKQALREIADTEYSGPVMQQTGADQTNASENSEGFTVDKTQDPFADKQ